MIALLHSRKIYWKNKIVRTYIPKKTIEGFMGGVVFCVVELFNFKILYQIAEGKMFIWIIIALIVGVLVLPVI
jgi:phosphatidate cytidylyltransferase